MIPIRHTHGFALAVMLLPVSVWAQSPGIAMQDYTSAMATTDIDGITISQQFGSPLGVPCTIEGDANYYQGLFSVINRIGATDVAGIGDIKADSTDDITMTLSDHTLTISTATDLEGCRLVIVDITGRIADDIRLSGDSHHVDISHLTGGTYMAGLLSQSHNRYLKTHKFVIR